MADNAIVAKGTTLSWNGATVAQLSTINGPELTVASVDTTTHQSADNYTTSKPGLITAGDISLEGYFDPTDTAGQHAMITDLNAGTSRTWIITFPSASGTTWTGTGYLTSLKVGDAAIDGNIPFTATIKPTSKPTFAVATVVGMSACGFSNDVLMMPTFAIGVYEYVVTITAGQTSTVVTPVDATSGEIITITTDGANAQVVATGEASSACTLDVDDVTQIVATITKTGYAPKSYYFNCVVLAG